MSTVPITQFNYDMTIPVAADHIAGGMYSVLLLIAFLPNLSLPIGRGMPTALRLFSVGDGALLDMGETSLDKPGAGEPASTVK